MNTIGWKDNKLKYADASMLFHVGRVSQFPQLYESNKNKYQILTRPYVGIYEDGKSNPFLKEKWIIESEKSVELLLMVSISDT